MDNDVEFVSLYENSKNEIDAEPGKFLNGSSLDPKLNPLHQSQPISQ